MGFQAKVAGLQWMFKKSSKSSEGVFLLGELSLGLH